VSGCSVIDLRVVCLDVSRDTDISQIIKLISSEAELPQETKPIYALESLPELIGKRQFEMLCNAMGIEILPDILMGSPIGEYFAMVVERDAIRFRQVRSAEVNALSRMSPYRQKMGGPVRV
jgi:hypothetical protein